MARGKFVYRGGGRTVEEVVRKSKQSGGAYDSYLKDVQLIKIKEGESTIRIMPPSWSKEDDEKWGLGWDIGIWIHYDVGQDKGAYLCLDKMNGEMCPVCEARREGTDEERDALKPQWRALAWVINRDDEKAGPQVWSMPPSVFREINLRSVDKKQNTPIPIDDPEEGYDVVFSREGTGLKTKYTGFEVGRESSPLHDNQKIQDKWLDYISDNPLPDILQFYDAAHIESVLYGKKSASEEDEDGGGRRERRRSRSSSDEKERDYLDGEDEEEKPRSRRARAKDDEEDEDEGESRGRGRPSTRRRAAEEDDESDDSRDEEETATRSRGGGAERRRAKDEEDDEDERPTQRSRRGRADEDEDAKDSKRTARRREEPDEEEPDPDEDEDDTAEAKRKLKDMGERRRRR